MIIYEDDKNYYEKEEVNGLEFFYKIGKISNSITPIYKDQIPKDEPETSTVKNEEKYEQLKLF